MQTLSAECEIVNRLGLHTRAAAKFVRLAEKFESDVQLIHNGEKVNGKSILGILMLAAGKGSQITLVVKGKDQEEAFAALKKLIQNGFDEK